MKKLVYSLLVLCSAGLLAWACNSMDESVAVTDLEETLELKTPSGIKIARDMLQLKDFCATSLNLPINGFEIVDISYASTTQGYVALITYILSNNEVREIMMTNWVKVAEGKMMPPPLLNKRLKTKSEASGETDYFYVAESLIYYCMRNTRCSSCKFKYTISDNDQLTYACLCKAGGNDGCELHHGSFRE